MPHAAQRELTTIRLGRHLMGLAAILFGVLTLVWQNFDVWEPIPPHGSLLHSATLVFIAAAAEILGGLAILWRKTSRLGAVVFGGISSVFVLLTIPPIIAHPLVYNPWGDFFQQCSVVAGALIIFATVAPDDSSQSAKLARIGYFAFGISVVSAALEQIFYLSATASLVPKWIPPGRMFWAIATTVAFALAAIALLSGRSALLASRLLTAMLVGFALLVWLPALASDPHSVVNWTEGAETLAVAAAAWIVADFLSQDRLARPFPRLDSKG